MKTKIKLGNSVRSSVKSSVATSVNDSVYSKLNSKVRSSRAFVGFNSYIFNSVKSSVYVPVWSSVRLYRLVNSSINREI